MRLASCVAPLNVVDRTGADRAEHDVFGSPASHHHRDLVFELFKRQQVPILLGHLHGVADRASAAGDDVYLVKGIAGRHEARDEGRATPSAGANVAIRAGVWLWSDDAQPSHRRDE
jgi:hypothetical protein